MSWKNVYRIIFTGYFALFLLLMHSSGTRGDETAFWFAVVLSASAGQMVWLSIFRPRHK